MPNEASVYTRDSGSLPPTQLPPYWAALEELASGNESFIRQISTTFLTEAPLPEELLAEDSLHDLDKLAQVAHKLKGHVTYSKVSELHTQINELECTARRRDYQRCEPLICSIRQQWEEVYMRLPKCV